MKETITEYSRTIIVLISFALMCAFILGGTLFKMIGKSSNGAENTVVETKQMQVLEQLEEREHPILEIKGNTYTTGTLISLYELIVKAETLAENNKDKIDLKDRVQIFCDSECFDEKSKTLLPTTAGIYSVKYTIKDDYGLSTTMNIKLVVSDAN